MDGTVRTHHLFQWCLKTLGILALSWTMVGNAIRSAEADAPGVQVAHGFEVTLYADDALAHDIFSMTTDSFGRIVVSGAGYVKILEDTDGDGIADKAIPFVDGPKTGAQGMYFVGRDLLCSGDGGLIRYRDRDQNDRADGPPDTFLKTKTGGEHDLHAIRKGPDGWWYVIAGNMTGINDRYVTLKTSPVKHPEAGTLMRFQPDLSKGEVITHGIRNAYDFDFAGAGDLFTFDSDGERDISLPWYRPTRVFHCLPGSHLGWKTKSWKRPNGFFDMPPVLAEFGRGSPSGVECYEHDAFPEKYRGALFVLDWTYGRVMALPMKQNGSVWSTEPVDFMSAVGQHGFAPTDVTVGADGALYVCVGGRGTRGSVYRIRAVESDSSSNENGTATLTSTPWIESDPTSKEDKLDLCLQAPQPLSSWSRRLWEPVSVELTSEPFLVAAADKKRSVRERVRAIEILTEKFNGIDGDLVNTLSADESALIRARAIWSIGRTQTETPNHRYLAPYIIDRDPLVVRSAMEAMLGGDEESVDRMAEHLGSQIGIKDRFVRQSSMQIMTRMSTDAFHRVAEIGYKQGWYAATPVAGAYAIRKGEYAEYPIEIALRILKAERPVDLKLEATRLLQLGLGDLVPDNDDSDPVFEGYVPAIDLAEHEQKLDRLRIALDEIYPSGDDDLDWELERIISMVQPANDNLITEIAAKMTADSHPVHDIHRLIVLSRIPAARSGDQRKAIANALVLLESKIAKRKLRQDSNWDDRVLEIYMVLVDRDEKLAVAMLDHPQFGHPGHVQFVGACPPERFDDAISAFVKRIESEPDYEWNPDIIFLLGESDNADERNLIREHFDDYSLRNAIIMTLASEPKAEDRRFFVQGLETAPVSAIAECVNALGLLPPSKDPVENVILLNTLRNLTPNGDERGVRDQIAELLRLNLGVNHGYRAGRNGDAQQDVIEKWTATVQKLFPEEVAKQNQANGTDPAALAKLMKDVDWDAGNAVHGLSLFKTRGCVQCHNGRRALGPDLSGVAGRFSRNDLFTAIAFPHRDVSPRYQTIQIATTEGHVRTGLIVYESVDGLVLRDANNKTWRIETEEIEVRKRLSKSIMPTGLLKDLKPSDLADLNAYLRTLGTQSKTRTADAK